MNIGKKLKELRLSRNDSINELAKKAGVAQSYISNIEMGNTNPTIEKISKILSVYNISLPDFFKEEDEEEILNGDLNILLQKAKDLSNDEINAIVELINAFKKK